LIQGLIYVSYIQPEISSWGATSKEYNSKLIGDDLAPYISSTRAIDIDAPIHTVWKLLINIGADRAGFYAYTFLEKLLGYDTVALSQEEQENVTMIIGREVPTTVNKNDKYTFPVAFVKEENFFVLRGWGTFLVQKLEDAKTRLIIRSHGLNDKISQNEISNYIFEPLHFIMERRMFLGIKAKAQNTTDLANYTRYDIFWFFGIILSFLGIFFLMFRSKHFLVISLVVIYSITWTFVLFILSPFSYAGLILCFCVWITYLFSARKVSSKDESAYFIRKKNNW